MVLHQSEIQHHTVGERERLVGKKNSFARLIAPPRSGVDTPRGVVLAVNRELDRAVNSLLVGLVVKLRLEVLFQIAVVGSGFDEFHFDLVGRFPQVNRFDLELAQCRHPFDRAARTIARQVRIGQLFQLKRADEWKVVRSPEIGGPLRRSITRCPNRAVVVIIIPFAIVAGVDGSDDRPIRLVGFD